MTELVVRAMPRGEFDEWLGATLRAFADEQVAAGGRAAGNRAAALAGPGAGRQVRSPVM